MLDRKNYENKKDTKMSELQSQSPSEPSPFKIVVKPWTPEQLAEQDRKTRILEDMYSRAADEFIERIPEHLPVADKLAALYSIFLDEMAYDHAVGANVTDGGFVSAPDTMNEFFVDGEVIRGGNKEVAILKRTGVCAHFSDAFSDIANKLGIPCVTVSGKTKIVETLNGSAVGLSHAWNQVLINGEVKNIDITYGLYANDEAVKGEKEMASELTAADFFLVDSDELRRIGSHHNFEDSVELLPEVTS